MRMRAFVATGLVGEHAAPAATFKRRAHGARDPVEATKFVVALRHGAP